MCPFFFLICIVLCFSHQLKRRARWVDIIKRKTKEKQKNRTTWLKVYDFSYSFPKCNNHCHFRPPLPPFFCPKIPLYFYGCKLLVPSRMLLERKFEKKDVLKKKIKTETILSRINILDCWGWLAWAPRANVGTKSLIRKIWVSEYSCLCVCVCVCLCFSLIQPSVRALKYAIGGHVWAYGTSRWPFRALTKKISEDIRNGQKSTWKQQIFENF